MVKKCYIINLAFWPRSIVEKVLCKGVTFKLETISKLENLWNFVASFVKEKSLEDSFKENLAVWCYIDQGNNHKAWKEDIFY